MSFSEVSLIRQKLFKEYILNELLWSQLFIQKLVIKKSISQALTEFSRTTFPNFFRRKKVALKIGEARNENLCNISFLPRKCLSFIQTSAVCKLQCDQIERNFATSDFFIFFDHFWRV